jgi:CRP/FNR family cyclic AMP-dependent transcriptional regulator
MKSKNERQNPGFSDAGSAALQAVIVGHPFFRGLSAAHLRILAGCAMRTAFRAGEPIFRQGDMANRLYLIEDGKVALETDQPGCGTILIQTLGSGDALGWSWLFPPCVWRFGARAVEPTRAIFFYGTWLREQCEQDPGFGCKLMERMVQVVIDRLQATRQQLVEISQIALKAQSQALRLAIQHNRLKEQNPQPAG